MRHDKRIDQLEIPFKKESQQEKPIVRFKYKNLSRTYYRNRVVIHRTLF